MFFRISWRAVGLFRRELSKSGLTTGRAGGAKLAVAACPAGGDCGLFFGGGGLGCACPFFLWLAAADPADTEAEAEAEAITTLTTVTILPSASLSGIVLGGIGAPSSVSAASEGEGGMSSGLK